MKGVSQNKLASHQCYFHPQHKIVKFCLNTNCTLPLCEKCLPIHLKQHLESTNKNLGDCNIEQFEEALNRALKELSDQIQRRKAHRKKVISKVEDLKQEILQEVNRCFKQINDEIKNDNLQDLEQKHMKLKKGSLKGLIYYYSSESEQKKGAPFEDNEKLNSTLQLEKLFVENVKSLFSNLSNMMDQFDLGKAPAKEPNQRIKTEGEERNYGRAQHDADAHGELQSEMQICRSLASCKGMTKQALNYESVYDVGVQKRLSQIRNRSLSQKSRLGSVAQSNLQRNAHVPIQNIDSYKDSKPVESDHTGKGQEFGNSYRGYSSVISANNRPQSEAQSRGVAEKRATSVPSVFDSKIQKNRQSRDHNLDDFKISFRQNLGRDARCLEKPFEREMQTDSISNLETSKFMGIESPKNASPLNNLDLIRKKYSSTTNQNLKQTDSVRANLLFKTTKNPSRVNGQKGEQPQVEKSEIKLDRRVLTKEEIRLNIEKRFAVNGKLALSDKKLLENSRFLDECPKKSVEKPAISKAPEKASAAQVNEFTLNANGNKKSLKERYEMSSVKREPPLWAVTDTTGHGQNIKEVTDFSQSLLDKSKASNYCYEDFLKASVNRKTKDGFHNPKESILQKDSNVSKLSDFVPLSEKKRNSEVSPQSFKDPVSKIVASRYISEDKENQISQGSRERATNRVSERPQRSLSTDFGLGSVQAEPSKRRRFNYLENN